MKIEQRSDGLHISGYVNVTGKFSKPIITPHGRCIETIEERAFSEAIEKNGNIFLNIDHDNGYVCASTSDGTLELKEDSIGLHANVLITDPTVIELAQKGKIKGWSFGMHNVIDKMEERADDLPLRHVQGFDLDHVSLIVNQSPCYSATSVECRAEGTVEVENRLVDTTVEFSGGFNNSSYIARLKSI